MQVGRYDKLTISGAQQIITADGRLYEPPQEQEEVFRKIKNKIIAVNLTADQLETAKFVPWHRSEIVLQEGKNFLDFFDLDGENHPASLAQTLVSLSGDDSYLVSIPLREGSKYGAVVMVCDWAQIHEVRTRLVEQLLNDAPDALKDLSLATLLAQPLDITDLVDKLETVITTPATMLAARAVDRRIHDTPSLRKWLTIWKRSVVSRALFYNRENERAKKSLLELIAKMTPYEKDVLSGALLEMQESESITGFCSNMAKVVVDEPPAIYWEKIVEEGRDARLSTSAPIRTVEQGDRQIPSGSLAEISLGIDDLHDRVLAERDKDNFDTVMKYLEQMLSSQEFVVKRLMSQFAKKDQTKLVVEDLFIARSIFEIASKIIMFGDDDFDASDDFELEFNKFSKNLDFAIKFMNDIENPVAELQRLADFIRNNPANFRTSLFEDREQRIKAKEIYRNLFISDEKIKSSELSSFFNKLDYVGKAKFLADLLRQRFGLEQKVIEKRKEVNRDDHSRALSERAERVDAVFEQFFGSLKSEDRRLFELVAFDIRLRFSRAPLPRLDSIGDYNQRRPWSRRKQFLDEVAIGGVLRDESTVVISEWLADLVTIKETVPDLYHSIISHVASKEKLRDKVGIGNLEKSILDKSSLATLLTDFYRAYPRSYHYSFVHGASILKEFGITRETTTMFMDKDYVRHLRALYTFFSNYETPSDFSHDQQVNDNLAISKTFVDTVMKYLVDDQCATITGKSPYRFVHGMFGAFMKTSESIMRGMMARRNNAFGEESTLLQNVDQWKREWLNAVRESKERYEVFSDEEVDKLETLLKIRNAD